MKTFDIELAKAGYPVQTRDGKSARIICFDAKVDDDSIIALISIDENTEEIHRYNIYGKHYVFNAWDLVMTSVKKEGWINIYTGVNGEFVSGSVFKREADAINNKVEEFDYITTKKIEWEE